MNDDQLDVEDDTILGSIMDEFMEAVRCGKTPPLSEFVSKYPHLEQDIRDLLPMVAMVEHSPPSQATGPVVSPKLPSQLGGYEILDEIGRGGMGVVYRAKHTTLGREVALKVLPQSSFREGESQERFRREAKAAASLHHTNIVPVFEIGQEGDINFFVMQYIDGLPLDRVQKELHSVRFGKVALQQCTPATGLVFAGLSGRLAATKAVGGTEESTADEARPTHGELNVQSCFRGITEIGIQVADALQYAHERGVVHRDVKPANLLIDAKGVVWLTDFGVAKTEDDDFTRTGQLIGTLRYMSPERFLGKCDHTSDIYSLGATLYELLTLRPAFGARDRLQLIEQIGSREPVSMREIDRRIPVDLETIVVKTLEKDPQRRYQSAGELMEDLRRFRDGEPILARSVTRFERAAKWVKRSPLVATLAALLVLVGTLGFSFSTWQWQQAAQERDDRAAAQVRAEENLQKARAAVLAMLTQVGDDRLRNVPHMEILRQQLLEEALKFNRGLLRISNDPEVRADTGEVHLMLADIYLMLGRTKEAQIAFGDAETTFTELHDEFPASADWRADLAKAYVASAGGLAGIGEKAHARKRCTHALALLKGADDDDDLSLLVARAHYVLAGLENSAGNPTAAISEYDAALEAWYAMSTLAMVLPANRHFQSQIDSGLGDVLSQTDKMERAGSVLEEMLRSCKALADQHPKERSFQETLADAYRQVGMFRKATGDRVKARQDAEQSLAVQRTLAKDFPHIPDYRRQMASSLGMLAISYAEAGDYAEAEVLFGDCKKESERLAAEFPQVLEFRYEALRSARLEGIFFYNSHQTPLAIPALTKVVKQLEQLASEYPDKPYYRLEIALALHTLGHAHRSAGNFDDGIRAIRHELDIEEKLLTELPDVIRIRHKVTQGYRALGQLYGAKKDFLAAESNLKKAVQNQRLVVAEVPERGEHHRHLSNAIERLAMLYLYDFDDTKYDEAEALFKEAIALEKSIIEADPTWFNPQVELAFLQHRLAELYEKRELLDAAIEFYTRSEKSFRALILTRKSDPGLFTGLSEVTESQARVLAVQSEWPAVIVYLNESLALMQSARDLRPDDDGMLEAMCPLWIDLARAYLATGQLSEASEVAAKLSQSTVRERSEIVETAAVLVELSAKLEADGEPTTGADADASAQAIRELKLAIEMPLTEGDEAFDPRGDARFGSLQSLPEFADLVPDDG